MTTRLRQAAFAAAALGLCLGGAAAFERGALWQTVRACTLAQQSLGLAFPCLSVAADSVVIRAPLERSHVIVVPTRQISGIEHPALLQPGAGAYWRAAWEARAAAAGAVPGAALQSIGIAANARAARSQDQFHIHADCVGERVRADLAAHAAAIGPEWRLLPFAIDGRRYYGRSFAPAQLPGVNPLSDLVEALPALRAKLATTGLALIPTGGAGGVLLANVGARVAMEDLLDHSCGGAAHAAGLAAQGAPV